MVEGSRDIQKRLDRHTKADAKNMIAFSLFVMKCHPQIINLKLTGFNL